MIKINPVILVNGELMNNFLDEAGHFPTRRKFLSSRG